MSIKPIRNDDDLQRAFKRLEKIFPYIRAVVKRREWYKVVK
jgi:hypothetical protein